jgi:hypothetical protein
MQADGPASGPAGLAAQIDAALDAAFAAVEAALAGGPVPVTNTELVAELLVRGLTSSDTCVARRAALAIAAFVQRHGNYAAPHAVVEASSGAAVPALARLATSSNVAAAGAALSAVASLMASLYDYAACVQAFAATDGAVEALINTVMQQAVPVDALEVLKCLVSIGGPEASLQVPSTEGLCARLVSFVAAVGNDPWQPGDDRFRLCVLALQCMHELMSRTAREAAVPAFLAAEGFWPALEGALARGNGRDNEEDDEENDEADAVELTLWLVSCLIASAAAARIAAGRDGLLAGLTAALARPQFSQTADGVLHQILSNGDGKAAVAAAVAGALASAPDEATRQQLREWLAAPSMRMEEAAITALERKALEAEALRVRVAELEAIPVNTRAAIVELAHAVRSKRPREEEGEAAGEEREQRRRCG